MHAVSMYITAENSVFFSGNKKVSALLSVKDMFENALHISIQEISVRLRESRPLLLFDNYFAFHRRSSKDLSHEPSTKKDLQT